MMPWSRTVFRASLVVAFVAFTGVSCGPDSNLNQMWGKDEAATDSLLLEAQAKYDRGDYEGAYQLADKLYNINPDNEKAAVLLGYVSLALGGIDPFIFAKKIIDLENEKKSGDSSNDDSDDENSDSKEAAGSSLTELSDALISMSDEEELKLRDNEFEGSSGLFDSHPLFTPVKVDATLRQDINILKHATRAVSVICRFVDPETKLESDERHADCETFSGDRRDRAKSHFVWALAHLTEALVYQKVLLYSSPATDEAEGKAKKSNFERAAEELDTTTGGLSEFSAKVRDMKSAVDQVMKIGEEGSMLVALLDAIKTVNLAFAKLAGLPSSFTSKMTAIMNDIETSASQIKNGEQATQTDDAKALKGQLTKKLAKVMKGKIDDAFKEHLGEKKYEDYTTEEKAQVDDICATYDELVVDLPEEDRSRPAACPSKS